MGGGYLGDEDDGALGLTDAAAAIAEDEAEPHDAGGADLPVAAGSVGHPLEGFRAHRAAVVHGEIGGARPEALDRCGKVRERR